jgi:hypothetical protein
MRKIISFTIIMGFLLAACQKDVVRPKLQQDAIASTSTFNKNKVTYDTTLHDEIFNWTLFDSCRQENVSFSGLEHYKLYQTGLPNGGFYIYYEIDVTGVIGTAERTGTVYKGDLVVIGTVTLETKFCCYDTITVYNRDGTSYTYIDTLYTVKMVNGKNSYSAVFKSAKGDRIELTQKSVYKEVNGRVVIEGDGKPVETTCK